MRSPRRLFCLFLGISLASLGSGCGPDGPHVASLALSAENAGNGEVPCPRGRGVLVTVEARDQNGESIAIDPSQLRWSSSDASVLEVAASADGSATITARRDWFDASAQAEPSAALSVSYGDVSAAITARGVIDATGTWVAMLDRGFSYTLELTQSGRTVVDTGTGYTGVIADDALSLDISGFQVDTTFSSRTEVAGTYSSSSGLSGTLTCTKQ